MIFSIFIPLKEPQLALPHADGVPLIPVQVFNRTVMRSQGEVEGLEDRKRVKALPPPLLSSTTPSAMQIINSKAEFLFKQVLPGGRPHVFRVNFAQFLFVTSPQGNGIHICTKPLPFLYTYTRNCVRLFCLFCTHRDAQTNLCHSYR